MARSRTPSWLLHIHGLLGVSNTKKMTTYLWRQADLFYFDRKLWLRLDSGEGPAWFEVHKIRKNTMMERLLERAFQKRGTMNEEEFNEAIDKSPAGEADQESLRQA